MDLQQIYEDVGGFKDAFYRRVKALDPTFTLKKAEEFLRTQGGEQVMRRRRHNYFPIESWFPFQRVQIDLMDMKQEPMGGYKWILNCIDVYTRYAYSVPMKGKLTKYVLPAWHDILAHMVHDWHTLPDQVDSDRESAFIDRKFKALCDRLEIRQNFAQVSGPYVDKLHTAIVEAFNGVLRRALNKFEFIHGTDDWVSALPIVVDAYNHNRHVKLGVTPTQAVEGRNTKYEGKVRKQIKKTIRRADGQLDLRVGDLVRHKVPYNPLYKVKLPWSKTVHKITDIEDLNHIYISGIRNRYFKWHELQAVSGPGIMPSEQYEEEKAIRPRGRPRGTTKTAAEREQHRREREEDKKLAEDLARAETEEEIARVKKNARIRRTMRRKKARERI